MFAKQNHFDVIVIGGGPMGLATAYQLSKQKVKTLVLEQFRFVNQLGSSAGISRQYRIPYPDAYMVQMALDAQPYWDELQNHTPTTLLDKVGTLWFGDPTVQSTEGNIKAAEDAMNQIGVPYTQLTAAQIEKQYHFKNLPKDYVGLFQADGASINLKATQETLLSWNQQASAYVELREEAPVIGIKNLSTGFEVKTPQGVFKAEKIVLVPGPYIDELLKMLKFQISAIYWNMASAYFKKKNPKTQYPTWFVFQNAIGKNGNQFYGFPEVVWDHPGYIRVAPDFVMQALDDPKERSLVPNKHELAYTVEWVKQYMTGLDPKPFYTSTCMVALSTIANKELIIDFAPPYIPNHKNIVIYATGWAAKFVPLMGSILADMAINGSSSYPIGPFKLGNRFFSAF